MLIPVEVQGVVIFSQSRVLIRLFLVRLDFGVEIRVAVGVVFIPIERFWLHDETFEAPRRRNNP